MRNFWIGTAIMFVISAVVGIFFYLKYGNRIEKNWGPVYVQHLRDHSKNCRKA